MTTDAVARTRRVRVAVLLLAAMVGVISTVLATAGTQSAHADTAGSAVTVSQTNPALYAYNPKTKKLFADAPTITVSQTQNLVNQVVHVTWSNFTPSINVGGTTGYSQGNTYYAVGIYECRVDPTVSFYGAAPGDNTPDCYNFVQGSTSAPNGLGNAVQTFTAADGTGEADIQVETAAENDYLGCSEIKPCSIAVVPNWGGIQDTTKDKCSNHKQDTRGAAGQALDTFIGEDCSWNDRLFVPIHFAPTPTDCDGNTDSFASEGSPMLERAMAQWRPAWCSPSATDPLTFDYDSGTNEYEARDDFATPAAALTSGTDTALTTQPLNITSGITYAPISDTAISVAFVLDDPSTGTQITKLNLDARLIAKLLTQSYSLRYDTCTPGEKTQSAVCDPAVFGNPHNILLDPEFKALNPQYAPADFSYDNVSIGEFLPIIVAGNSDLIYELTDWIAHDPAASAFLRGVPDQWGMRVNSYYKNISYPTSQIQILDPGFTDSKQYAGFGTMQITMNPVSGLDTVSQYLISNQTTAVDPTAPTPGGCGQGSASPPCTYGKKGPENTGTRALFAIMDEGDAAAFNFPTANLENASGAFVGPTTAGVAAAVGDMQTDTANGVTQSPNFASTDPAAYPLAAVDYAAVRTCGMAKTTAAGVSQFLALAASSAAQTPGSTVGTLAEGYTPLSSAQEKQTDKVASQLPDEKACPVPPKGSTPSSTPSSTNTTQVLGEQISQGPGGSGGDGSPSSSSSSVGAGAGASGQPSASIAAFGTKAGNGDPPPALMMPALIIAAAVLLLGGPGLFLLTTDGRLASVRARLAPLTAAAGSLWARLRRSP